MRDGDPEPLPSSPGIPQVDSPENPQVTLPHTLPGAPVGCATLAQNSGPNDSNKNVTGSRYYIRGPEFWQMVVNEYLKGEMQPGELARKYGVSTPNVNYHISHITRARRRASAEGVANDLEFVDMQRASLQEASIAHIEDIKDTQAAWIREAVERSYALRDKIDEGLEQWDASAKNAPHDLKALAGAEEITDKIARRSLGLGDKMELAGGVDVRTMIAAAVQVYDEKLAKGETIDMEGPFHLAE